MFHFDIGASCFTAIIKIFFFTAELVSLHYKIIYDAASYSNPVASYLFEIQTNFPTMNSSLYAKTLFEARANWHDAEATFYNQTDVYAFIDVTRGPGENRRDKGIFTRNTELQTGKTCHELEQWLGNEMYYSVVLSPNRDQILKSLSILEQSGIFDFFEGDVTLMRNRMVERLRQMKNIKEDKNAEIRLDHVVPILIIMAWIGGIGIIVFLFEVTRYRKK